jgi:hypothetical protein
MCSYSTQCGSPTTLTWSTVETEYLTCATPVIYFTVDAWTSKSSTFLTANADALCATDYNTQG